MKKLFLYIACFIFTTFFLIADDIWTEGPWTYYPKSYPESMYRQTLITMDIDNDGTSIVLADASYCYSRLNTKTGQFDSLKMIDFKFGNVVDISSDDDGNVWALTEQYVLKIKNDSLIRIKPPGLEELTDWKLACFSKNHFTKELFLTLGYMVWRIKGDSIELINLKELGSLAFFINNGTQGTIYFKEGNKTVFSSSETDTLFYLDFDNMENSSAVSFKKLGIPDEYDGEPVWLNKLYSNTKKEYILMDYHKATQYPFPLFAFLYEVEDGKATEIILEAPENMEILSIKNFIVTESGNILAYLLYTKNGEIVENYYLCEYTPDGKIIKTNIMPVIPADNVENPGTLKEFVGWRDFLLIDNELYFHTNNNTLNGVLKYSPESSGVEANIDLKYKLVLLGVRSIYPNPTHAEANISFFCLPSIVKDLEFSAYDYLGNKFSNIKFELVNFDTNTGRGEIKVDLSGLPTGPKYIMLTSSEESATASVMVY